MDPRKTCKKAPTLPFKKLCLRLNQVLREIVDN